MSHRIEMSHYGPPEVLQLVERPLPPPGPDEVRFRVLAAAVNHADLEIRAGHWQILAPNPFPYTPRSLRSGRPWSACTWEIA